MRTKKTETLLVIHKDSSRHNARRRGATAVEFALTVPILFMFMLAAIEFSRANMLRHTAVVAATEGARRGIVSGATAQECLDAATNELAVVGFPSAEVTIAPTVITHDTTQITVNVDVPLNGDNGFVVPKFLGGAHVVKSVTLQREAAEEAPDAEEP